MPEVNAAVFYNSSVLSLFLLVAGCARNLFRGEVNQD
jgi:hypothetical protein